MSFISRCRLFACAGTTSHFSCVTTSRLLGRSRIPIPEVLPEALQRLLTYHWPGNARELKDVAERWSSAAVNRRVDVGSLPLEIGHQRGLNHDE